MTSYYSPRTHHLPGFADSDIPVLTEIVSTPPLTSPNQEPPPSTNSSALANQPSGLEPEIPLLTEQRAAPAPSAGEPLHQAAGLEDLYKELLTPFDNASPETPNDSASFLSPIDFSDHIEAQHTLAVTGASADAMTTNDVDSKESASHIVIRARLQAELEPIIQAAIQEAVTLIGERLNQALPDLINQVLHDVKPG